MRAIGKRAYRVRHEITYVSTGMGELRPGGPVSRMRDDRVEAVCGVGADAVSQWRIGSFVNVIPVITDDVHAADRTGPVWFRCRLVHNLELSWSGVAANGEKMSASFWFLTELGLDQITTVRRAADRYAYRSSHSFEPAAKKKRDWIVFYKVGQASIQLESNTYGYETVYINPGRDRGCIIEATSPLEGFHPSDAATRPCSTPTEARPCSVPTGACMERAEKMRKERHDLIETHIAGGDEGVVARFAACEDALLNALRDYSDWLRGDGEGTGLGEEWLL